MRFCLQCGAALVAGAKFCVECGERLTPAAAAPEETATAAGARPRFNPAFVAVMAGMLIAGLTAAALLMRNQPARGRASATAESAGTGDSGLPANHPAIKIPKSAVDF